MDGYIGWASRAAIPGNGMECILTQWSGTNGMEEMEMERMDGWMDGWIGG